MAWGENTPEAGAAGDRPPERHPAGRHRYERILRSRALERDCQGCLGQTALQAKLRQTLCLPGFCVRQAASSNAIHSRVGRLSANTLKSDGRRGFLVFGPYEPVESAPICSWSGGALQSRQVPGWISFPAAAQRSMQNSRTQNGFSTGIIFSSRRMVVLTKLSTTLRCAYLPRKAAGLP